MLTCMTQGGTDHWSVAAWLQGTALTCQAPGDSTMSSTELHRCFVPCKTDDQLHFMEFVDGTLVLCRSVLTEYRT